MDIVSRIMEHSMLRSETVTGGWKYPASVRRLEFVTHGAAKMVGQKMDLDCWTGLIRLGNN